MFLLFSALLVPLFGLHHFVAAFKPDSEGSTKFAIEVISALTISFQVSVFEKKKKRSGIQLDEFNFREW